jgi:hypothetical protein
MVAVMSTHRRRLTRVLAAALVLVLAPATAAHADDPPTTGSVAGTLADGATPVPDTTVELVIPPYGVAIKQTRTDAAGAFRLTDVVPREYALRFRLAGGLIQFHPAVADLGAARLFGVVAGAETVIRESVMPHGTLGGRVTTHTGAAAAGARVELNRATPSGPLATVLADADGNYLFRYPPSGQHVISVAAAERGATRQWAHQHRVYTEADPFTIAPGQHTTVDEQLFPTGAITGRFTRDGVPVANVVVYAYSQASTAESVTNWTDADGVFRLKPYPGTYKLKFVVPAGTGLDQWLGGTESEAATQPVRVTAGETVTLDERQLPTGMLRGRLTDRAGQPPVASGVVIEDAARGRQFQATTAADGTWFKMVWPGTYTVMYQSGGQVQWATGERSPQTADPVRVVAGGTTQLEEVLLPTGSLAVRATDRASGAAITTFCATAYSRYVYLRVCTEDGVAELALSAGRYEVTVADGVHPDAVYPDTRVGTGQLTRLNARL